MTSWKTTETFTITLGDVTVASITSGAVSDGLILNDDTCGADDQRHHGDGNRQ